MLGYGTNLSLIGSDVEQPCTRKIVIESGDPETSITRDFFQDRDVRVQKFLSIT